MHYLRTLRPDPVTSFADARARLRADPWQSILSAIGLAIVIGFAIAGADSHSVGTLAMLMAAAVVFHARVPFPVLSLGLQVLVMVSATRIDESLVGPTLALTVFSLMSISIERPLPVAIAATIAVQLSLVVYLGAMDEDEVDSSIFGVVFGTAGAAGLGVAIRSQRQYIKAINDRAIHAEETREAESRRRVSEERVRIARDLHDAVAHHMAVVGLYTGLARTTLRTSIEQSEDALAKAQDATRSVLGEMQQILHILRDTDSLGTGPREPAPDFTSIEELLASFGESGIDLDVRIHGAPGAMTTATGLVLYRVLQEALTNAHKHGDGSAEIDITFGERSIQLVVANPVALSVAGSDPGTRGTGHGLIGMKERMRMIDGTLTIDATTDRFVVRAELPRNSPRGGDAVPGSGKRLEPAHD
jgi:signal transduction histidine kinase